MTWGSSAWVDDATATGEVDEVVTPATLNNVYGAWGDKPWGWVPSASTTMPTIGRPISDTTPGLWTPSTGTDLFACIDETTPSDTDYISVASASMCEMAIDTTVFPGGATQVLSYRASSTSGSTLTVRLRQSGSTIASWSHALTGTDTLYTQTLTAPQVAALASGSVSVQLEAS